MEVKYVNFLPIYLFFDVYPKLNVQKGQVLTTASDGAFSRNFASPLIFKYQKIDTKFFLNEIGSTGRILYQVRRETA